jgi:hypothetical protein
VLKRPSTSAGVTSNLAIGSVLQVFISISCLNSSLHSDSSPAISLGVLHRGTHSVVVMDVRPR